MDSKRRRRRQRQTVACNALKSKRYAWAMTTSPSSENPGHELDLVPVFSSGNHDAEMEALAIHSLLEANGIPSTVVGPSTIPSVEFQVQVPHALLPDAERVMLEAQAAGPDAAEEAEANTEPAAPPQGSTTE